MLHATIFYKACILCYLIHSASWGELPSHSTSYSWVSSMPSLFQLGLSLLKYRQILYAYQETRVRFKPNLPPHTCDTQISALLRNTLDLPTWWVNQMRIDVDSSLSFGCTPISLCNRHLLSRKQAVSRTFDALTPSLPVWWCKLLSSSVPICLV